MTQTPRMLSDDEILKSIKIKLTPEQEIFLAKYHSGQFPHLYKPYRTLHNY